MAVKSVEEANYNEEQDYELSEYVFPSCRIDWQHVQLWHLVWILYFPVGFLLALFRLLYVFVCKRNKEFGYMDVLFTKQIWDAGPDFQWPHKCVILMERHGRWLETATLSTLSQQPFYLLSHQSAQNRLFSVWTSATASDDVLYHPDKNDELMDKYKEWSEHPGNTPLLIFPQGYSTRQQVVSTFTPTVMNLLDSDTPVVVVGTSVTFPIPLHQQLVSSHFMADLFWLYFQPTCTIHLQSSRCYKMSEFMNANHAASELQRVMAEMHHKQCVNMDVFDKKRQEERRMDGHGTSLALIRYLQSSDFVFNILFYPCALIHYLMQEIMLLFMGALWVLFDPEPLPMEAVIRCTAIMFMVVHLMKIFTRVPRPLWIDPTLRITRFVWQTDYSFPSGHSGLTTALVFGLIFTGKAQWDSALSIAGFSFALITGFSRLYLGMHHVDDILVGWIIGFCVSFFWIQYGGDAWFTHTSRTSPLQLLWIMAIVFIVCLALQYVAYKMAQQQGHVERVVAWNDNLLAVSKNAFPIEPHKMYQSAFPLASFIGIMTLLPLSELIGSFLFIRQQRCLADTEVTFWIFMCGCILIYVLINFIKKTWVVLNAVGIVVFIWWLFKGSLLLTRFIQSTYSC